MHIYGSVGYIYCKITNTTTHIGKLLNSNTFFYFKNEAASFQEIKTISHFFLWIVTNVNISLFTFNKLRMMTRKDFCITGCNFGGYPWSGYSLAIRSDIVWIFKDPFVFKTYLINLVVYQHIVFKQVSPQAHWIMPLHLSFNHLEREAKSTKFSQWEFIILKNIPFKATQLPFRYIK
jgi:hypothetical protein